MRTDWTEEETAKLLHLWKTEGLTASEIGNRIGRSRNSVLGKVNRTKDAQRPTLITMPNSCEPEVVKAPARLRHQNAGTNKPTPRDFLRAASAITGETIPDILDLDIRRSKKSQAPLIRRALLCAMHGYYKSDDIAEALGMQLSSIASIRYRNQGVSEVKELAEKIEARAFNREKPAVSATASATAGRPHPGYSTITAAGMTIRRCPVTGEVLFHPNDAKAFAHLLRAQP